MSGGNNAQSMVEITAGYDAQGDAIKLRLLSGASKYIYSTHTAFMHLALLERLLWRAKSAQRDPSGGGERRSLGWCEHFSFLLLSNLLTFHGG